MKKFLNKIKKSILFYTLTIIIIFIASLPILNILNIQYRQWVYYFMILLSITGLFASSIQIALKNNKTFDSECLMYLLTNCEALLLENQLFR